jgi:hypothetical protein
MKILGCDEYHGLENNQTIIEILHGHYVNQHVIPGNLFDFDFSTYDILYSYTPIADTKLMYDGICKIMTSMKPRATFYFACIHYVQPYLDMGFVQLKRSCVLKYTKRD